MLELSFLLVFIQTRQHYSQRGLSFNLGVPLILPKRQKPGDSLCQTKEEKYLPKMLLRAKKLSFRFHFSAGTIIIVLAILLCSSGHDEVIVQASCSQALSAWMKVGDLQELVQQNQDHFLVNLLDCLEEIHEQIPKAPRSDNCKTFKGIIPSAVLANVIDAEIPKVIDESTSMAAKERLALLSVYLMYICHETGYFSCRAANFSSMIKHLEYPQKFQRLLSDLKPILHFLNLELMPEWKSDNISTLKINADALIKMLNQFSTRLKKLSEEAFHDVYQNSEQSGWWRVLSVDGLKDLVVFVGVLFCAIWLQSLLLTIIAVVGAGVYFASYSTLFYSNTDKFSSETVEQFNQLKTDTDTLHDEIVKLKRAMERISDGYSFSFYSFYNWIRRYFF